MKSRAKEQGSSLHIVIVIILVAAVLGLLGYVFWSHFIDKKSPATASTSQSSTSTAMDTVSSLKALVDARLIASDNGYDAENGGAKNSKKESIYSTNFYKPTGYNFTTAPKTATGFGSQYPSSSAASDDYQKLTAYLTDHGFSSSDAKTGMPGETYQAYGTYVSSSAVCYTNRYTLEPNKTTNGVCVGCADISSYIDAAKDVQPFYDAYIAVAKNAAGDNTELILSNPKIRDGVNGYKNAQLVTNDAADLFYKVPGKDWQFYMSLQQGPICNEVNTPELRMAFAGSYCYSTTANEDSTVKAP